MTNSTPIQLRFPPLAGCTVRANFDVEAMSCDFGPLLLRGVDQQIGLTHRLAAAIEEPRRPGSIDHPLPDLLAQRIYQIACGYEDANDANALRSDPLFKLALDRKPLDPNQDLASAATFCRLENELRRKDIYRIAYAFVDQFIASYAQPPQLIVIDLDHSEDPTHGQQEGACYNGYYRSQCYLPLFIFEGLSGKLITAVLRTGNRPTGAENAAIVRRLLKHLRQHWPQTWIVLRGDGHFSNPELMAFIGHDPRVEFVFGLSDNAVLSRLAEPTMAEARQLHEVRCQNAQRANQTPPAHTRLYTEFEYAAQSWPQAWRVVLKAEVTPLGDNPRFVVTSLELPTAQTLYQQLYCARGQDENYIKMLKNDLKSDRTSDHRFLANAGRMYFACAAYVLLHTLRSETLRHTELAQAQPATLIGKLFKVAVQLIQYKDRIKLRLPSTCEVQHLLKRVTEILYQIPAPCWDSS